MQCAILLCKKQIYRFISAKIKTISVASLHVIVVNKTTGRHSPNDRHITMHWCVVCTQNYTLSAFNTPENRNRFTILPLQSCKQLQQPTTNSNNTNKQEQLVFTANCLIKLLSHEFVLVCVRVSVLLHRHILKLCTKNESILYIQPK